MIPVVGVLKIQLIMTATDFTKKEKVFCEDCKFYMYHPYDPPTCRNHPLSTTQYVERNPQWKRCSSINTEGECVEFEMSDRTKKNMLFLIPCIVLLVLILVYVWCSCSIFS